MTEPRMSGTKTCPKCKVERYVIEFAVSKIAHDGLNHWCRSCTAKSGKKSKIKHNFLRKINTYGRESGF